MFPTHTWNGHHAAHQTAHDHAHKEATRVASKVRKAIKSIYQLDDKRTVVEAAYRTAYEPAYRESYQQQIVDLIMLQTRSVSEEHLTDLATQACRGLSSLLGVSSEEHSS